MEARYDVLIPTPCRTGQGLAHSEHFHNTKVPCMKASERETSTYPAAMGGRAWLLF